MPVPWPPTVPRPFRRAGLPRCRRSCRRRLSWCIANLFDGLINGRLIDAFFPREQTCLLRRALPLGFGLLRQMFVEQQAIFFGQMLNSLQNFLKGLAHGNFLLGGWRSIRLEQVASNGSYTAGHRGERQHCAGRGMGGAKTVGV